MILSYLSGEVFRQDFRKGMLCRQLYKDIPDNATGTASCKKCYMNLPEAFQCRFLLTEGIGPWPEEAVGDITDISSGS
jgi:hypothetical protein